MKQKTIMCFGDSNTWGYPPEGGCRYGRDIRWPGVLQERLGEGYYVIEEGLCGRTTVWEDPIEGDKCGIKQLVPLISSHCPLDLVVIMLGTNDLKNRFGVSALDIAWSVGRLVDTVRKPANLYAGSVPEVLVVCPPPLADMSKSPFKDILIGGYEKSKQLAGVFTEYFKDKAVEMLDAGGIIESSPVDGVHFSPQNQIKLGKEIALYVEKMLG